MGARKGNQKRVGVWRESAGLTRVLQPGHCDKRTNPGRAALCHCQFSQKTCARDSQCSYPNGAPPTGYHPALTEAGCKWVGRLVFQPVSSKFPLSQGTDYNFHGLLTLQVRLLRKLSRATVLELPHT